MPLILLRFTTILLVALLTGFAFAHVHAQSAKMQYDAALYITLQKRSMFSGAHQILAGCLNPQRSPQPALLVFFMRKSKRGFGSPWEHCSHCLVYRWQSTRISFKAVKSVVTIIHSLSSMYSANSRNCFRHFAWISIVINITYPTY